MKPTDCKRPPGCREQLPPGASLSSGDARIQELERQHQIEKEKNQVGEHLEKLIADMEENEEVVVQDPQFPKDFETVFAEWNDWDQKNVTIEGVELTYFFFNPMKVDKAIPQVVKKATRNMDVHNIMLRHDNPNANLAEEWNKLSREEKQMWLDRKLKLNDFQKYQKDKGWIEFAEG